jgi:signal transduction histidine kinase
MRSITFRFSGVFLFVLAVVIVLGSFSAWRLSGYRIYSDELRDRFFRSTQYIGDLNNFTSDFRAAEATALLGADTGVSAADSTALAHLDAHIALAEHSYEHVDHDAAEWKLYGVFKTKWSAYRDVAGQGVALLRSGRGAEAVTLYKTVSAAAYDAASDTLGSLTDLNVANATAAAQRADSAYQQARILTILAMTFAGLMVVGGLVHMRRFIADPLVKLAKSMDGLARSETGVEIPGADRRDEIGAMARAVVVFRKNAIDLAVSERALAEQAAMLAEQLAAEQHLTEMQRNFLSMASHEFRTPLTVIDGHAQRLINARARLGPEDIGERAGKIRIAVLRVTSVIDSLLETARLMDRGASWDFKPIVFDVVGLLAEVCRQHREIAPNISILERYESAPLNVRGDPRLLQIVFANLVSNGIKYSVDDAQLAVRAWATEGAIEVRVEDKGVGIPKADLDHLFDRYVRGSNVSAIVGTGVGLYLVKTVVDLHGGEVAVESREGQGARFTVRLPFGEAIRQ